METLRRREKMLAREEFHEECQRTLRAIELSAYGELMEAIRASGVMDDPKREFIDVIRKWFRIPEWRHRAEARRVATDERLSLIADTLSGNYTTQDWLEEGYGTANQMEEGPIVAPLLSEQEMLYKVIERRLLQNGVDVRDEDDNVPMDVKVKTEVLEMDFPCVNAEKLNAKNLTISTVDPEKLSKLKEEANGIDSKRTCATNPELDIDDALSEDGSNRKRRRRSSERRDSHSLSPDIANFSNSERRKKIAINELSSRLSHTSNVDLEREKRRAERDSLPKIRKSSEDQGGNDEFKDESIEDRSNRDVSVASSSSSCISASEAVEGIMLMMAGKPRPTRGRGLTRVRGRSQPPYAGRGRGRGRGKSQFITGEGQWASPPPQFMDSPIPDSSTPRIKVNGDEAKKRVPYKRKKQIFQNVSNDDLMESPGGILNDSQRIGQGSPTTQGNKMNPNYDQQFLRGNNQYYDSHYYDRHSYNEPGSGFNPISDPSRPSFHHHHNDPEFPPKIRQKTKHTVIIQDPHESIPGPPPLRNVSQFVEHNNDSTRHYSPTMPLHSTNSVIVRTPSSLAHPPNTPPKIINPMSKTHITITQNPKPPPIGNNRPLPNIYDNQSPMSSPYRNATPSIVSAAYKKRTQNLAAATTYTPQSDSILSSDGESGSFQQNSSNTTTNTPGATASSLAVRSRPMLMETKPSVSTIPTPGPPLPALTSVVRLPSQQNSTTPVVQRKAQPHILVTSKIQRNAANANLNTVVITSSGPVVSNIPPVTTTTPVSTTTTATTSNDSSVIQAITPIPIIQGAIPSTTSPTFGIQSTGNVVSLAKSIPNPIGMTRAPNIIFVQKNPNTSIQGQQAISSPTIQPGAMVKGSGKAVILRRANNSNVMVLNLQKSPLVNPSASSPVSQYIQSARFVNAPQIVNQMSSLGVSPRKIIQTSGKILTPSATTIITSATTTNPSRTTRIFTTQSGNAVAIAVGKPTQIPIPVTQTIINQQKPTVFITKPKTKEVPLPTLVQSTKPTTIPVATSSKVNISPSSLNSSVGNDFDEEIAASLLSNEEMMEASPPPMTDREIEEFDEYLQPNPFKKFAYPKTKISVVTNSPSYDRVDGERVTTSILNQALLAKKKPVPQPPSEVQEEDEFEEDEEDEDEEDDPINTSTISSQSLSSSLMEEEEESEDTQNESEEQYDEREEEIELIDLADDDLPDPETRNQNWMKLDQSTLNKKEDDEGYTNNDEGSQDQASHLQEDGDGEQANEEDSTATTKVDGVVVEQEVSS